MTIEVETADRPMTLESIDGRVRVRPGRPETPDLVLSGPPDGVIGMLAGKKDRSAVAKVKVAGDVRKLVQLHPNIV